MKLYYTDSNGQKKLIAQDECVMEIVKAANEDAKRKFVMLKRLQLANTSPEKYTFITTDNEESGYSIEE